MNGLSQDSASWHQIDPELAGQRIDNYLMRHLKGVPKSHVYRILRSGEVRVDSRRVGPEYRLREGDRIRLPPLRIAVSPRRPHAPPKLMASVLYEDEGLLAIDKPAGVAVHGGSGVSFGVVEQLRHERPQARFLELVHRLDRDTSGVLLLATKRAVLTGLHAALREGRMRKVYQVLVWGKWRNSVQNVKLGLTKRVTASGERRVRVDDQGQPSHTVFRLLRRFAAMSLLEAELKTGRTHQIRVHLAHLGFPIAGDDKYGDRAVNQALSKKGLKRMFLHAASVEFRHPVSGAQVSVAAPLPGDLERFLLKAGDDAEAL